MTATTKTGTLYLALELGWDKWLMACATEGAGGPRYGALAASGGARLQGEIAKARRALGWAADARVCSCLGGGREGFWLPRALRAQGISNVVVDSAAIEATRRHKRAKTDP